MIIKKINHRNEIFLAWLPVQARDEYKYELAQYKYNIRLF